MKSGRFGGNFIKITVGFKDSASFKLDKEKNLPRALISSTSFVINLIA